MNEDVESDKAADAYSLSKAEDQILQLIEYIEAGGDWRDLPTLPSMRQSAGE